MEGGGFGFAGGGILPCQPSVSRVQSRHAAPADVPLSQLESEIVACRACPRLVAWREEVAATRRAAFRDEEYWARPVAGFGDPAASIVVVGLAPAAHGGNRTGRVFTGDRSGDWLFASLYRCGLANQPTSVRRGDGLELDGVWVTASVRCAPPANRPTPAERDRCLPFLAREVSLLTSMRVSVALGQFGYDALARVLPLGRRPRFGHGVEAQVSDGRTVICSYHPSQQNTFTGRLTEAMLDAAVTRAWELASSGENIS